MLLCDWGAVRPLGHQMLGSAAADEYATHYSQQSCQTHCDQTMSGLTACTASVIWEAISSADHAFPGPSYAVYSCENNY